MLGFDSITLWHNRLACIGYSTIIRDIKCGLIVCNYVEHDTCKFFIKSMIIKKLFQGLKENITC